MNSNQSHTYADIINLPHHVSKRHPPMPLEKRAAQFSPFAAMVGHDAALRETARLTEAQRELSEEEQISIDRKLRLLQEHLKDQPEITLTYFQPDKNKADGAYVTRTSSAKKIDTYTHTLVLTDGTIIPIKDVIRLSQPFNPTYPHPAQ